ncbi:hypothetical protein ACFLTZ_05990 [Chloroflexota bacterium]
MEITSIGLDAIIQFLPLTLVSIMAFWKENSVLFMITAGLAMITGLYAPDILSGNYITTSVGIAAGLMFVTYSFLCAAFAFKLMMWSPDDSE